MKCKICGTRKAGRYCPGVQGDICSLCCGTQREATIDCPLDCPYLREARLHEKRIEPKTLSNADIVISDEFVRRHENPMLLLGYSLTRAALANRQAVDSDVRQALEDLIRTYRTLSSGLYFDSRPVNPFAAGIYSAVQRDIAEFRDVIRNQGTPIRDAELLALLVLFDRMASSFDNGRPKGRSFIDSLARQFALEAAEPAETKQPSAPLIVL